MVGRGRRCGDKFGLEMARRDGGSDAALRGLALYQWFHETVRISSVRCKQGHVGLIRALHESVAGERRVTRHDHDNAGQCLIETAKAKRKKTGAGFGGVNWSVSSCLQ